MKCWPWKHEWKFCDINSHSYKNSSDVLEYCVICGKFRSYSIPGCWCIKHKYEIEDEENKKIIKIYERI